MRDVCERDVIREPRLFCVARDVISESRLFFLGTQPVKGSKTRIRDGARTRAGREKERPCRTCRGRDRDDVTGTT